MRYPDSTANDRCVWVMSYCRAGALGGARVNICHTDYGSSFSECLAYPRSNTCPAARDQDYLTVIVHRWVSPLPLTPHSRVAFDAWMFEMTYAVHTGRRRVH